MTSFVCSKLQQAGVFYFYCLSCHLQINLKKSLFGKKISRSNLLCPLKFTSENISAMEK